MDRQQLLPVGEGEVDQGLHDLDAGVADQHVDAAVLGHGVGHAFFDLGLVDDVHRNGKGVAAPPFARTECLDLGRGLVGSVEIEVGNHRDAAFGGEAQRDFLADTAGGAGDDGNSSLEARHDRFLFYVSYFAR